MYIHHSLIIHTHLGSTTILKRTSVILLALRKRLLTNLSIIGIRYDWLQSSVPKLHNYFMAA